jgi:septum formation protein
MKKIILASASPQRKKLMRLLHLPFTVCRSKAEELTRIKNGVAALVKTNALLKARDVASRTKGEALVIGADTVVYTGEKLILKPVDLHEAKANLKLLMSRPHWVYTGVAVIDAVTGEQLVEHERTRVFMNPLDDEGIDRYHRAVSPLDKAGGFDIEGRGALFIPRIEGCYSNVVGLPVSRLARMLAHFGVRALMLVFLFAPVIGCSGLSTNFNTATGSQETTMYSTDREQELGASVARDVEKHYMTLDDVELTARVERIMERIAAVCGRNDIVYVARVVQERKDQDEPLVNAISLPGGYIYIFKGLLDLVHDDNQLAAVIAHETAHITARHSVKRLQASYGSLAAVLAGLQIDPRLAVGINTAANAMFFEYSQEDEIEADTLGLRYMSAAGYDPAGMIAMLEILQDYDRRQPPRPRSQGRTHPYIHQRIASVGRQINGDLTFRDYIRLTGEREDYKK